MSGKGGGGGWLRRGCPPEVVLVFSPLRLGRWSRSAARTPAPRMKEGRKQMQPGGFLNSCLDSVLSRLCQVRAGFLPFFFLGLSWEWVSSKWPVFFLPRLARVESVAGRVCSLLVRFYFFSSGWQVLAALEDVNIHPVFLF